MKRKSIYLDHSATTPTDPRVVEAMMPYFTEIYGNPSSVHSFGRKAEQAVEDARETIASILNCQPSEIVFTSGGTEADNLAIRGAAWHQRTLNPSRNRLVTTPLEHHAVGQTVTQLDHVMDFERLLVPVDQTGRIDVNAFRNACAESAIMASVMYANNEVGTVEPIADLAQIAHEYDVLFHTDAVQAAGQMLLDVAELGVDLLSVSAHKFYGPKGVGFLYVRKGVALVPNQSGGSHENGLRAGTHNTPYIVGMAKALDLAYAEFEKHIAHYREMRDRLIAGILARVPQAQLSGHPNQRLPSHASFVFAGLETNQLLMHLDLKGIAASGGSACKTGSPEPSDVLLALGYSESEALSGLRLTVGRQTTAEEIDYTIDVLQEVVEKLYDLAKV
ncbi:MAG: cysteine desulfurase [Anaerolineae bacterium]|nr:cysteine desulfurase [Anaerolineae bacterium]